MQNSLDKRIDAPDDIADKIGRLWAEFDNEDNKTAATGFIIESLGLKRYLGMTCAHAFFKYNKIERT